MRGATAEVRAERAAAWAALYQTLKAQGRTQTWLAAQVGVSRSTLGNFLHGESRPPAEFLSRAARALHVRRSDIAPPEPMERFFSASKPQRTNQRPTTSSVPVARPRSAKTPKRKRAS